MLSSIAASVSLRSELVVDMRFPSTLSGELGSGFCEGSLFGDLIGKKSSAICGGCSGVR